MKTKQTIERRIQELKDASSVLYKSGMVTESYKIRSAILALEWVLSDIK